MAGVSRLQYAHDIRLIRVMCSGRVDLDFILRAFAGGQDGVFIGGCKLNECNYVTHGNYDALGNTYMSKKIMKMIGLNPSRLTIKFMSGGDGNILAEVVDEFTAAIKEIGPLGESEGVSKKDLALRIEAARKLVPYLKLVERERLRIPEKTEQGYTRFWESVETDKLLDELIGEKLAVSQIMSLLSEKPLSTVTISEALGLTPSEVSKLMNSSSRQGLVRYDVESNCYARI